MLITCIMLLVYYQEPIWAPDITIVYCFKIRNMSGIRIIIISMLVAGMAGNFYSKLVI